MTIQTYRDITFVLGPPSGERYEKFTFFSLNNNVSFSEVYLDDIQRVNESWTEIGFWDKIFSAALGQDLNTNRVYITKQVRVECAERFKKFYVSPEEKIVQIPAIMFFPPEFTDQSGGKLGVSIKRVHANGVGAVIGKNLKLDWVHIHSALNEGGDVT